MTNARAVLSPTLITYAILDEWMEKAGMTLRNISCHNRRRASYLIDMLEDEYHQFSAVPENHPDLERIRFWLGAYDDAYTHTDIEALQSRLLTIATYAQEPVNKVLMQLADSLSMSISVMWKKLHHNEFTVLERRRVWHWVNQKERRLRIVKKVDSFDMNKV